MSEKQRTWISARDALALGADLHAMIRTGWPGLGVVWNLPTVEKIHRRGGVHWMEQPELDQERSTIVVPLATGRAIPEDRAVTIMFCREEVASPSPIVGRGRYPGDDALVREAFRALEEGKVSSARQAAALVAGRADGSSREAKIDRLRGKLGEMIAHHLPTKPKRSPTT